MYQDNTASITMNNAGGGSFRRSKHMLVRNNFIQEHITNMVVKQLWISTNDMIADGGTKPKWGSDFSNFVTSMNMK